MDTGPVLEPMVQHGFVGVAAVLLVFLAWVVRRLLSLLESIGGIIHDNTQAIRSLDMRNAELVRLVDSVRDRLLSRPCIADRERKSA